MNVIVLIGNAGKEPDVKMFENGNKVAKFSMAINEGYKSKGGEWVDKTLWVNIVAWGGSATYAQKAIKKGVKVAVQGKLSIRKADDGKYYTEVIAHSIEILTKRTGGSETPFPTAENETMPAVQSVDDKLTTAAAGDGDISSSELDDLPF